MQHEGVTEVLPYDGPTRYLGKVLEQADATHYFQTLLEDIQWKHDEAKLFGKHYVTKRKAAWYGDEEYTYTYSNTTKTALPWTAPLRELKELIERISGASYNSCLLNLYHDGSEGMAWHSDGEKTLKSRAAIASMSLGAERKFAFKHKRTKETHSIVLEHGSLLLMEGTTQEQWLHRLPPTKKIHEPRVNLTFRKIRT